MLSTGFPPTNFIFNNQFDIFDTLIFLLSYYIKKYTKCFDRNANYVKIGIQLYKLEHKLHFN